ncbi:MAG: glycosyltransferase family 4 protein [Bacteroidales bacterium]|nr:glycosyltransferase family 4 protein [Bacteroidales bacterium]
MKILMLLEADFPPDIRVENEILALTGAENEVHLACYTKTGRPERDTWGKAVIYRKKISQFIYKSSVGCLKFPFYFNFWRKFLIEVVSTTKFDAVHVHDLPLSLLGLELKKALGIPLIIDLHENWPSLVKTSKHTRTLLGRFLSPYNKWVKYEKKMLMNADRIITVIEEARERVINLDVDPEKVIIVSNTINTETIKINSTSKKDDAFALFYGGGINQHRGLQVVLEAVKILHESEIQVRFIIVGDGSYRKDLEKLAERLGIGSLVNFTGRKSYNEMMEILSSSDAAVIPHLRTDNNDASSPNKLYQYMYLGKPVITADCLSLKRIVTETGAGFVYKNDSPDDLAKLIINIRSDKSRLEEAGRNGTKAVLEKYNWNNDSKRLTEMYSKLEQEIIGNRKNPEKTKA